MKGCLDRLGMFEIGKKLPEAVWKTTDDMLVLFDASKHESYDFGSPEKAMVLLMYEPVGPETLLRCYREMQIEKRLAA